MLKGPVQIVREDQVDPNKSIADAMLEMGRRTDASNRALVEAVKGIVLKAPEVQVAAPQVKVQLPANAKPTKWVFKVERDADGRMTQITAEAQ